MKNYTRKQRQFNEKYKDTEPLRKSNFCEILQILTKT